MPSAEFTQVPVEIQASRQMRVLLLRGTTQLEIPVAKRFTVLVHVRFRVGCHRHFALAASAVSTTIDRAPGSGVVRAMPPIRTVSVEAPRRMPLLAAVSSFITIVMRVRVEPSAALTEYASGLSIPVPDGKRVGFTRSRAAALRPIRTVCCLEMRGRHDAFTPVAL